MPHTQQQTDSQLQQLVTDELGWTPAINNSHVGVAADHGAVTLAGEVDTYPQKLLAEQAALRVRGVSAVANDITVRYSWAEPSDTDVAREAGEALERAVDVPAESVKAVVEGHHITLHGVVAWHHQREAADRAVRYVKGVFGVSNAITIKPTVSASGLNVAIAAALARNAQLEAQNITVAVQETHVTLEGNVHSWSDRHQAEATAWSAPGVTEVDNLLDVQN
jgi:osmotically-inducible protein OsmY